MHPFLDSRFPPVGRRRPLMWPFDLISSSTSRMPGRAPTLDSSTMYVVMSLPVAGAPCMGVVYSRPAPLLLRPHARTPSCIAFGGPPSHGTSPAVSAMHPRRGNFKIIVQIRLAEYIVTTRDACSFRMFFQTMMSRRRTVARCGSNPVRCTCMLNTVTFSYVFFFVRCLRKRGPPEGPSGGAVLTAPQGRARPGPGNLLLRTSSPGGQPRGVRYRSGPGR